MSIARIVQGDCRTEMRLHGLYDMILADPPYGDTSLKWDRKVDGWLDVARETLKPTGSMWVFGSFKFFFGCGQLFQDAGFRLAQEIIWEKQNGSSLHADRFKRVHEIIAQFYCDDAAWESIWNEVQTTPDATARTIRRKKRPAHTGNIKAGHYVSEDGGPRLMRSVVYCRNAHGYAIHETEKPVALLEILIRTSCPPGGLIGDFFAGSGAGGDAARMCGRNYIGCEIRSDCASAAADRLKWQLPLVAQ